MIEIRRKSGRIEINGHAGFAPRGHDIVCAGVSALVQVFIASVEELTEDNIKADIADGRAVIEYKNLSERGQLLKDSFLLGLEMIATEYPYHVRIAQAWKA